jgi:hypothetical protein
MTFPKSAAEKKGTDLAFTQPNRLTASRRRLRGIRVKCGLASDAVAFGLPSDAVAFGLPSDAVAFGLSSDAVAFGLASDAVAFGLPSDAVAFGLSSDAVAFGLSSDAVAFGLASDAVAFGLASDAVAFGLPSDAVAFGLSSDAVAFGLPLNEDASVPRNRVARRLSVSRSRAGAASLVGVNCIGPTWEPMQMGDAFFSKSARYEAVKKRDWLRAETAKTLENQRVRRCLSQFFHSLYAAKTWRHDSTYQTWCIRRALPCQAFISRLNAFDASAKHAGPNECDLSQSQPDNQLTQPH